MSVRTHPGQWVSAQGQYAGSASRFAAYLIDLIASTVLYLLALAIISFVVQIVTGSPVSWHRDNIAVVIIYVARQFLYFGFQWAADGSTWEWRCWGCRWRGPPGRGRIPGEDGCAR